ncbi:MAG: DUF6066 family protein [Anaeromyxobacteraceae bacterium]
MTSRRSLRLAALLAALSLSPAARATERFEALASGAQRLESLGPFLERYVGSCRDAFTRDDCERNVRASRRALDGRLYAATLGERTVEIVKPERTRSGWRFVVTPFIDGGGLALTNGAPQGDAQGRPRIGFLVLEGALPEGMDEMALESALRTGRLGLEVLFRPEGTWKLKRRGEGGFYEGVKARFLALRIVETRSGTELASRVY